MNELTGVDAASILGQIGDKTKTQKESEDKTDFLQLLVAQLSNQDPLNPQDSTEFMSQLAQLETVQGIQDLNKSFASFSESMLSNQALQATSLVGRDVLVSSNSGLLQPGQAMTGRLELPSTASSVKLNVFNSSGALVRELYLGDHPQGNLAFSWDGIDNNGQPLPSGQYAIAAQGSINGETVEIPAAVNFNVDSVTLDPQQGTLLNLAGLAGTVSLTDVLQVR